MSKTIYNFIKYVQRYVLPALATLVLTLTKIWALPYGVEIAATITAVTVFLGACLGISKTSYNRGKKEGGDE